MTDHTVINKIKTAHFEILIFEGGERGYFEHEHMGDDCAGGLWFEGKELTDYDGVFALPNEVSTALREAEYIVDEDFEDD